MINQNIVFLLNNFYLFYNIKINELFIYVKLLINFYLV